MVKKSYRLEACGSCGLKARGSKAHGLLFTLLLLFSNFAWATTSAYTGFYIPYQRIQNDSICLHQQIMEAEFGIPLASMMTGIFAPTRTLQQSSGAPPGYTNINLLHNPNAPIPFILNFDRYHPSGITDYSFTLDLAALHALNGNSVAGRQKTVGTAKLAVIAVVKTAELLHGAGKFRLWLKFDSLPSNSGLSGAPVFSGNVDWPGWPYTSSSPLYQAYKNEMIAADC